MILKAKKIYISFDPLKTCQAVVISGDSIVFTGTVNEATDFAGTDSEFMDFGDNVMMPGFIDSHMHLDELGRYLSILDLRGTKSISNLKEKLYSAKQVGGWILGHGWDQDLFIEKRWPTRFDLDEIISDIPVFLSRVDLHSGVLNSKAMEVMEIESGFHDSAELVKDKDEQPTGVVTETVFGFADRYVRTHLPRQDSRDMLVSAISECSKQGVTTVGFVSCSLQELEMLKEIRDADELTVRTRVYINGEELEELKDFRKDDLLAVSGIKLFSDGSLGSRTALMSFLYQDDPGNRGVESNSKEQLLDYMSKAEGRGLDVACHAIGDLALDNVLWAFSKCREKHRIEHASLVRKDQLEKIKQVGAILAVQPHFILTDFWTLERIGERNAGMAYPLGSIANAGIPISFSTDCPVEMLDPWPTVQAAVTRGAEVSNPLGMVSQNECMDVRIALSSYTKGSALALSDSSIGTLEPGKKADFLLLATDPLSASSHQLKEIVVEATYLDGERVYIRQD